MGSTHNQGLQQRAILPLYFEVEDHKGRGVTRDWQTVYPSPPHLQRRQSQLHAAKKLPRTDLTLCIYVCLQVYKCMLAQLDVRLPKVGCGGSCGWKVCQQMKVGREEVEPLSVELRYLGWSSGCINRRGAECWPIE